jgi:hypothetical protein
VVIGAAIGLLGALTGAWIAITTWINKHAESP